jgi:predicted nuclease of predicted toxin-antitoxin system
VTPRFLADECFSGPMFRALLNAGFDIVRSAEVLPSGDDGSVLALAFREGRVLLTEDTDFGKLTVQLGSPSVGLVRIVLKAMSKEAGTARAVSILLNLGDRVINSITVIEPHRVRIRPI